MYCYSESIINILFRNFAERSIVINKKRIHKLTIYYILYYINNFCFIIKNLQINYLLYFILYQQYLFYSFYSYFMHI